MSYQISIVAAAKIPMESLWKLSMVSVDHEYVKMFDPGESAECRMEMLYSLSIGCIEWGREMDAIVGVASTIADDYRALSFAFLWNGDYPMIWRSVGEVSLNLVKGNEEFWTPKRRGMFPQSVREVRSEALICRLLWGDEV